MQAPDLYLDTARADRLDALLGDLDPATLHWVSGYAAALARERARLGAVAPRAVTDPAASAADAARALILYASQTGNGRRLAERLGKTLEAAGLATRVVSAADFPARDLARERLAYFVVSTHGDGDAPDDARALFAALNGRRPPDVAALRFAVLALGDSSYPQFCVAGRTLDEKLAALGATRLTERIDCDVDIEAGAAPWIEQAVALARSELGASTPRLAVVSPLRASTPPHATRDQPLEIELTTNQRLTTRDAERDVRHLEFVLPDERLAYEPGDALGVWTGNPPQLVEEVLALTRLDGTAPVTIDGASLPLATWLGERREATRLARPFIAELARRTAAAPLAEWLAPSGVGDLRAALKSLQVVDLLQRYPTDWDAEGLVRALNPLSPRLYSIASSRREVSDEVHLAVAVVDYRLNGARRVGASSYQLAALEAGRRVRAYVEPNLRFRLPADGNRDVIMIGPGTGVAPFRGFLQSRTQDGAPGRNWLVFGCRHRERDFLYQTEWLDALKKGRLQRLDVAFSRDAAERVYVQDRLREQGGELFRWLEDGAHLYVCGDAERMAPDVHRALLDIVMHHGRRSEEAAAEYLDELSSSHRYAKDVY